MGGATPGLMVLDYIRKQAGHLMGSKTESNTCLWLLIQFLLQGSYHEFLPSLPRMSSGYLSQTNFFLFKLFLVTAFITLVETN